MASLSTLPHDLNHSLLLAAASQGYSTLITLSLTCRSLQNSFRESKPVLLRAALPNISPTDYAPLFNFAHYLKHLDTLHLLIPTTTHGPITFLTWVDTLHTFTSTGDPDYSEPIYPRYLPYQQGRPDFCEVQLMYATFLHKGGRMSRLERFEHPETMTPTDLLLDLVERVACGTANRWKMWPEKRVSWKSIDDIARALLWLYFLGRVRWGWVAELLGVSEYEEMREGREERTLEKQREEFLKWWEERVEKRREMALGLKKTFEDIIGEEMRYVPGEQEE